MKYLVTVLLLLPSVCLAQAITWEERLIVEVNLYRLEVGVEPLVLDARLSESGKWWAQALKGTGIMAHGWPCKDGYLVDDSGQQISRVWLPSDSGWTDFNIRNAYLGIQGFQSENGYFGKSTDPAFVCAAWATSPGHYSNMVNPRFTRAGAAKNTWGSGKSSVWLEVAE